MPKRIQFLLHRLREHLWVKPLIASVASVAAVLLAQFADSLTIPWNIPEVAQGSLSDLLKIIAASMLGVATFAVASMVAAYASTAQTATARAFPLVVADDVSQNALSVFVATFIFAVVALSATSNNYYGEVGRFTLFVLTLLVLVGVVLMFVRWVDSIARLGRVGDVIAKVELVTAQAADRRKHRPFLGGIAVQGPPSGVAFYSEQNGYLQGIDMDALQRAAVQLDAHIRLAVVPGAMMTGSRPLGFVVQESQATRIDGGLLREAFTIGPVRQFDDDPRFGLVVLSEIACRALSPGVNDPGTAISILGSLHRIFADWARQRAPAAPEYDRVEVPALSLDDMFDDVFPSIARDGAALVEVAERVQRVLGELGRCDSAEMTLVANRHAKMALARSERADLFAPDFRRLRNRHAEFWPQGPKGDCPRRGPSPDL